MIFLLTRRRRNTSKQSVYNINLKPLFRHSYFDNAYFRSSLKFTFNARKIELSYTDMYSTATRQAFPSPANSRRGHKLKSLNLLYFSPFLLYIDGISVLGNGFPRLLDVLIKVPPENSRPSFGYGKRESGSTEEPNFSVYSNPRRRRQENRERVPESFPSGPDNDRFSGTRSEGPATMITPH